MNTVNNQGIDTSADTRIARVILEHATRISGEQDLSALVGLHAALARDLVGGDRSSVWLIDEMSQELWTRVADGIKDLRIPLNTGVVGACISSGEVIIANDLQEDPRFHSMVDKSSGYRTESILCIPLRAANKTIGALQVLNKPGGFSAVDAELLGLMAVYAASAIQTERLRTEAEEARLLRRELDIARDVQMKLLPRSFPPLAGFEYTGFLRSARFVGGDYYDFIPLPDGAFAFTLGDVSGKGVPAAVIMASIHTLLRSLVTRNPDNLVTVFSEVNKVLKLTSGDDQYTTLFCGVVDAGRRELRYVNAGNVPPFLARNGAIESLPGADIPVGMLEKSNYRERVAALAAGDTLLCVSDGITEVRNRKFEFWDDRTIDDVLRQHASAPLDGLIGALLKAADDWSGEADQHDDMTLVAVRITS